MFFGIYKLSQITDDEKRNQALKNVAYMTDNPAYGSPTKSECIEMVVEAFWLSESQKNSA